MPAPVERLLLVRGQGLSFPAVDEEAIGLLGSGMPGVGSPLPNGSLIPGTAMLDTGPTGQHSHLGTQRDGF